MEAKPSLWFHVGPAKTGTTSLQMALHKGRRFLAENGVNYPRWRENPHHDMRFAHHYLAHSIIARDFDFADKFLHQCSRRETTVLSSEVFLRCGREGLTALSHMANARFATSVIYYARHPIERANSLAQELIKAGKHKYQELSDKPPLSTLRKDIEMLVRIFGADAVQVRNFSEEAFFGGDLISDFCHAIGRPTLERGLLRERHNISISLKSVLQIERLREAQKSGQAFVDNDIANAFAGRKFTLPEASLAKVWTHAQADLSWLNATYGINLSTPGPNTLKL